MRWIVVAVLSLAACADGGEYPPPTVLPAEYTECEAPSDCVVVELGCCDACNGGEARAVNAADADVVRDRYAESCGAGVACTEMGCAPWETTCDAGVCGLERGDF